MSDYLPEIPATVFEREWLQNGSNMLFRSENHQVMAVVDTFPRMPLQVVIAPAKGQPGEEVHFWNLPEIEQRKLLEVALVVGPKILEGCDTGMRSQLTIEGFGVPDHAHIGCYAGKRKEGINRFTGPSLGEHAVQHTLEVLQFTPQETELLEARLDHVVASFQE